MLLLNFVHNRQRRESDCLVACAEMALNHLGISLPYWQLSKLLGSGDDFTPFSRLANLRKLELSVTLGENAQAVVFEEYLLSGLPVIVGVYTRGWLHWGGVETQHAVVVVGVDRMNDLIYIHDPYFVEFPIEMSLLAFEMGWEEHDRQFAVIGLSGN